MAENDGSLKNEDLELDLYKCTQDFSKYCQVDITDEAKGMEESIEEMLANLDEFSHLADATEKFVTSHKLYLDLGSDSIRNDSSQILFILLPELCAKCQVLPTIFNRIDQLEVFMERIKKCVDDLEDKVEKAEEELGSHSIKKVLNAIPYLGLMQKKQIPSTRTETEPVDWRPPVLFKTSDFFKTESSEKTLESEGITTQLETSLEMVEPD